MKDDDVRYGRLTTGFGYVHMRRCKGSLPERMDPALAVLDDPDGRIVGLSFAKRYRGAGGTCAAICEKEDGRAYLIGETPAAGMSSSKTTIEMPSGLFHLYVSIHSNMKRSNGGEGIEGTGIPPHEIVPYDPEDLAAGRDTMILRGEALLSEYPQKQVPYDPEDLGWRK